MACQKKVSNVLLYTLSKEMNKAHIFPLSGLDLFSVSQSLQVCLFARTNSRFREIHFLFFKLLAES